MGEIFGFSHERLSKRVVREGVAVLRVAARHAALEPAHALLRCTVRERLGHDAALGLLPQAVIADGLVACALPPYPASVLLTEWDLWIWPLMTTSADSCTPAIKI